MFNFRKISLVAIAVFLLLSATVHATENPAVVRRHTVKSKAEPDEMIAVVKRAHVSSKNDEHFKSLVSEINAFHSDASRPNYHAEITRTFPHLQMVMVKNPSAEAIEHISKHHAVEGFHKDATARITPVKKSKTNKKALRGPAAEAKKSKKIETEEKEGDVHIEEEDGEVDANFEKEYTWGLDRIDQETLPLDERNYKPPSRTKRGNDVEVFIVDTGIDTTHREFSNTGGRIVANIFDVYNNELLNNNDDNGHGTHVAGTVGGRSVGVANRADLYGMKVLDAEGSGYYSDIISAMEWVAARKAQKPNTMMIVSMSLGGGRYTPVNDAVNSLAMDGVAVVVAAGNEAQDASNVSPASAPYAITVGATEMDDGFAYYSNYGTMVDILAPGSDITSACSSIAYDIPCDSTGYATISGTSMATPHVSGAVALWFSRNKYPFKSNTPCPEFVKRLLVCSAEEGQISGLPRGTTNTLLGLPLNRLPGLTACLRGYETC